MAGSNQELSGSTPLTRIWSIRAIGNFAGQLKPKPSPAVVTFKLLDVFHTFRPGHKIMVQVHSSWFPLVDRNPQTYVDIARAKESDFRKATQRVYRSASQASHLELQVMPQPPLP